MTSISSTLRVAVPLAAFVFVLSGCTTYYAINDPSSDRTYYTTQYKNKNGTLMFKDHVTGRQINIQNSEVEKISKETYTANQADAKK